MVFLIKVFLIVSEYRVWLIFFNTEERTCQKKILAANNARILLSG